MIFKQEMVDAILSGRKTVTRRVPKAALLLPCHYKVGGGPGGTYALQGPPGKGSKARAKTIPGYRLRVIRVNLEAVGKIDPPEARLEGFSSVPAFKLYWQRLHGKFRPTQLVHRIQFELVPATQEGEGK